MDNFIGTGSQTAFTLSANAVSSNTCVVTVNGITQTPPTNYAISGNIITFTSAPALNANVRVVQHGVIGTQVFPLDGTVTASKIAVGAVTGSALAANSITSSALGPTVNVAVVNTLSGNNALFLDNNTNVGFGIGGLDTTYNKNVTIYGNNTEVLKFGNGTTGIGASAGFDIGHLDASNKSNAYIWNRQTAPILFGTNNTEAARFTSAGNLQFAPSNAGIIFNKGSALNNQTLNDYEYGTWTPIDASGAGLTLSVSVANYTKIGRLVFVNLYLTYPSNSDGTGAGIGGLPFTSQPSGYSYIMGRCQANYVLAWQVNQNTTYMNGNTAAAGSSVTNANLSGQYILISGCYIAAS